MSLLEKAVVEADALRAAALKNAESLLVEKYSAKIKEAVDSMLEQDDDPEDPLGLGGDESDLGGEDMGLGGEEAALGGEDMGLGGEEAGSEATIGGEIPLAAAEGQKLCQCPDEEEEIEIDFGELERQMASEDPEAGEMIDREAAADSIAPAAEGEGLEGLSAHGEEEEDEDEMPLMEELEGLLEELEVDAKPVSSGYLGTNATERAEAGEVSLAALKDDETAEELEELKDTISDLQEHLSRAEKKSNKLTEQNKRYKDMLVKAEELIKKTNTSNAKLMYTNRILKDSSLNERQKKEFVDVVTKADTVDKAKMIYETFLRSAGSKGATKSNEPKSLSEVAMRVSRGTPLIRESVEGRDPEVERMKILAGLRKRTNIQEEK